jgi:hypothetical protein
VLEGRWARAEPTAVARARVLKNMLAMIFRISMVCRSFGLRAIEANVGASCGVDGRWNEENRRRRPARKGWEDL